MASLSHASSFATPNTQQTPLPKLLPSHLSMDPTSSSVSTLSQQHSSSELSWLQKPSAKLSYTHLHTMSSFNHQFGLSSPLYEGYSEAGESIDQGFIGGDDPLLTSSWEALDKLVSASMTNSGSANEPASMHVQSTSPSPISEVEQKPLSGFYSSNNQKGGVCNMWANNDQASQHANANTSSNGRSAASSVGLNLASLISADPGFVERAAKFSSYSQQINQAYSSLNQSNNNINPFNNALSSDNGKLSNYNNSSSSYKCPLLPKRDNVAMDLDAKSDLGALHKPCNNNTTNMLDIKRSKSPQAGSVVAINGSKKKREGPMKEGEVDDEDANRVGRKRAKGGHRMDEEEINNGINDSKVSKVIASERTKTQQSGGSNSGEWEQKSGGAKEISTKPCSNVSSQAPKPDFIHVRARRGQATDSHSLAERVRREKISERMKYLQDLVPGCTKVTGKAMMLDEIINYVQSLQRQVEFLSMKLAAVNPSKLEFNFESLFGKEVVQQPILQHNHSVSFAPETHHTNNFNSYPFNLHENLHLQPNPAFPESNPSASMHSFGSDAALRRTVSLLAAASSDTFGECISQITDAWEDDLHNIVHLAGFAQTPQNTHPSLQGALLQGQMKAEL